MPINCEINYYYYLLIDLFNFFSELMEFFYFTEIFEE